MPDHFEYVLAAYGIWVGVFSIYIPLMKRKARMLRQNIEALRKYNSDTNY